MAIEGDPGVGKTSLARALVHQASGDYLGMADALGPWLDGSVLDGRSRVYAVLWRPLLVEGLIGSGQIDKAATALDQLRADSGQVGYLRPALAWLEGWLAEQRGSVDEARRIYQGGEASAGAGSPVYAARLLLAHGRLLRRTGPPGAAGVAGRTGWPGTRWRGTGWWPVGSWCGTECSSAVRPVRPDRRRT